MGLMEKLKLLFTKEELDEDPIVVMDSSEEPLLETSNKPEVSKSDAEDPLKNVGMLPKSMSQEAKVNEVVSVPELKVEEKVEVKIVEVPPPVVIQPPPQPPSPQTKRKRRYDPDGFTSTSGLY